MSLINDMLRDLEARRAAEQRLPAGMLHGLSGHAPTRGARRYLLVALFAMLALLATAVAWLAWQRYGTTQPPVATAAPIPTPAPARPEPAVETVPASVATPVAVETTVPPIAVAPPPETLTPPSPTAATAVRKPVSAASITETSKPTPAAAQTETRTPKSAADAAPAAVEITARPPSPPQQAENEYQRGVSALRGGNTAAAESAFRAALRLDGEHLLARETLAAMLLGAGRLIEADEVLEQGRRFFARNRTLALLLARLRVEQGQTGAAVTILEQNLHGATARPDYLAFLAALYQRELRYDESIESYGRALALQPQQASWWAGMGISLENAGRRADAIKAYEQAAAGALPPQLQEHVRSRLKILQQ